MIKTAKEEPSVFVEQCYRSTRLGLEKTFFTEQIHYVLLYDNSITSMTLHEFLLARYICGSSRFNLCTARRSFVILTIQIWILTKSTVCNGNLSSVVMQPTHKQPSNLFYTLIKFLYVNGS